MAYMCGCDFVPEVPLHLTPQKCNLKEKKNVFLARYVVWSKLREEAEEK